MKKVNNMKGLIEALNTAFNGLQDGTLPTEQAREISRMAGKIIGASKVQLEYNKYMNYEEKIPFLEQSKAAA